MSGMIRYVKDTARGDHIEIYVGSEKFEPVCEWLRRAGFRIAKMGNSRIKIWPTKMSIPVTVGEGRQKRDGLWWAGLHADEPIEAGEYYLIERKK